MRALLLVIPVSSESRPPRPEYGRVSAGSQGNRLSEADMLSNYDSVSLTGGLSLNQALSEWEKVE